MGGSEDDINGDGAGGGGGAVGGGAHEDAPDDAALLAASELALPDTDAHSASATEVLGTASEWGERDLVRPEEA